MDINWRNVGLALLLTAAMSPLILTASVLLATDDQPDTTPCRTDVATMIQTNGPKAWPASCAGLSTGQQDEVSAAVVRDLLNG